MDEQDLRISIHGYGLRGGIGREFRRTSLFSLTTTRLHCTLSRPITDAISQCLLFSCWQKVPPPTPDLAFNTTSPSTWRPFAIIRVNTRPKDMEGSGGLSVLKKPKCQNVTRCQQPAALICRPLDDAHLIVSLGNLLEVSKRFPMSALQLLGSIIAARKKEN